MPIWCPPTPPTDDSDVYIDHCLGLLYEHTPMSEAQLPPVYYKRDRKRFRSDTPVDGRPAMKVRYRDENAAVHTPRSLFDRPSPAILKMRQEFRMQKSRGIARPVLTPIPGIKPQPAVKPTPEPDHVPEWTIAEDYAILHVIQDVQELPLSLIILSPGHTPNWDMVAEAVNKESRTYRSPKQCKNRYESVILPREEGKIVYDPNSRKQKKQKGLYRPPQTKSGRSVGTYQLFTQDKNSTNLQILSSRFDAILKISKHRTPVVKPLQCNPSLSTKNFGTNHAAMLAECNIDYDNPLTPAEVAHKRSERITREKQAAAAAAAAAAALQQPATKEQQQLLLAFNNSQQSAAGKQGAITPTKRQESSTVPSPVGSVVRSATPSSAGQSRSAASLTTSPVSSTAQKVALLAGSKGYSPAQLQLYREQALLRQQQQMKLLQSKANQQQATTVGAQKVSVAVSSPSAQQRQVKPTQLTARTVTESEMAAIMKRQQAKQQTATSGSGLSPAQILAQAGLQAQQTSTNSGISQVAALVKAVPGQTHIPVAGLLPQVKATLGANLKPATAQQVRQLTLQQQLLAAQRGRLPTQLMQVAKGGVPTQLIVQSQKTIPTTMTMQQIPVHQVMKPITHQITHVSAGTSSQGQVLSHTVLAKTQSGSTTTPIQTRVIPVASSQSNLKQTIQVVTAASGGTVRGSVPNVTIDSSGRSIKMGNSAQQQALYSQVSAALQQQNSGQQTVSVRPAGIRLQTTGGANTPFVAVAVTLPSPLQQQQQQQPNNQQ